MVTAPAMKPTPMRSREWTVSPATMAKVCYRGRGPVNVGAPIRLRDADVQRDGAGPDAAIAHVAQTCPPHRVGESRWAREALDGFRQVRVRGAIAGHERADGGNDPLEVEAENAVPAGYA